jgi:hypothetical protein
MRPRSSMMETEFNRKEMFLDLVTNSAYIRRAKLLIEPKELKWCFMNTRGECILTWVDKIEDVGDNVIKILKRYSINKTQIILGLCDIQYILEEFATEEQADNISIQHSLNFFKTFESDYYVQKNKTRAYKNRITKRKMNRDVMQEKLCIIYNSTVKFLDSTLKYLE